MIKTPNQKDKTLLIYYGGKSRDANWIISHFPHGWKTLVDVFGGGGAISFQVGIAGRVLIYNDIGNVVHFMKMIRDHGDELYRALYFTPYSRDEFEYCSSNWRRAMQEYQQLPGEWENGVEWARQWYTTINQGYTHEENSDSWHKAIQVNSGSALANHTDDLPKFVNRLRRMHIENMDFARVIPEYDLPSTLFYCDPPYLHETRVDTGNYLNEMPVERHVELLNLLKNVKGQVVLSGYASELYDNALKDWRRVTTTHKSSIQNSSSMNGRGDRTEVLWIREHIHGLWSQADVS
jgi:DNA adenine methylase